MKRKIIALGCSILVAASVVTAPVCAKSIQMNRIKAKSIIKREKKIPVDMIKSVDKYPEGKWYCYYIYSDGDVYVVTIKRNHVMDFIQLN